MRVTVSDNGEPVSYLKGAPEVLLWRSRLSANDRSNWEEKAEAYARELVRRIQDMRKEMDLQVEDSIKTSVNLSSELADLVKDWHEYISKETRSVELKIRPTEEITAEFSKDWDVEGEKIKIGLTKHI